MEGLGSERKIGKGLSHSLNTRNIRHCFKRHGHTRTRAIDARLLSCFGERNEADSRSRNFSVEREYHFPPPFLFINQAPPADVTHSRELNRRRKKRGPFYKKRKISRERLQIDCLCTWQKREKSRVRGDNSPKQFCQNLRKERFWHKDSLSPRIPRDKKQVQQTSRN